MSQHVHDSNFLSNLLSILRFDGPDKFCREARTWRFLHHPPYSSISTFAQFLQYFVSMIKQLSIFHFHYSSFERWLEFWKCEMFYGFSSLHTKYLIFEMLLYTLNRFSAHSYFFIIVKFHKLEKKVKYAWCFVSIFS